MRGALRSIPRGQREAGLAIGLGLGQLYGRVLLPQALKRLTPPVINVCTRLLKTSSLAVLIGVVDITKVGQQIIERTYESVLIYGFLFVFFLSSAIRCRPPPACSNGAGITHERIDRTRKLQQEIRRHTSVDRHRSARERRRSGGDPWPQRVWQEYLLRCLNGLELGHSGTFTFDGQRLPANADWRRVRQQIGMVFQSYHLFPHMTVLQNVLLGPLQVQKRDAQEARQQAEALLARVGLAERANAYPASSRAASSSGSPSYGRCA